MEKTLKSLRSRLAGMDQRRMARLKEAKENKDIRTVTRMWADAKLRPKILHEKQYLAIHFMTDFVHNFQYEWIAAKIGVSLGTIHNWMNDPTFLRELGKQIDKRITFVKLHAMRNIHRAIKRGSMKDTWKYMEMIGDFKKQIEITDRTGEKELDDSELTDQINELQEQLSSGPNPSSN
jgi:hypothetical protein